MTGSKLEKCSNQLQLYIMERPLDFQGGGLLYIMERPLDFQGGGGANLHNGEAIRLPGGGGGVSVRSEYFFLSLSGLEMSFLKS